MEILDSEKRRARNLIWNAAADYSFEPDFKAYDEDGRADLYWNSIIGAVRKNYGAETIEGLFESLHGCSKEQLFEQLLWLGLENAVYQREAPRRPALPSLRRSYARRAVALDQRADPGDLLATLENAHFWPGPGAERTAPAAQGSGNAGCPGVPRRPGRPCHCGAGPGIPPHLFPFHPRRDPGPGVGGAETAPPPLRLPPPVRGRTCCPPCGLWPRVRGASGEGPGRRSQRRAGPAPPDGLQPGPDGGRPAKIHAGLLRRPLIRPVAAGEPGAGALRGRAPGLPPVLRHRRRHS